MFRFWVSRNTFPSNAIFPQSDRTGCGRSWCEAQPAWAPSPERAGTSNAHPAGDRQHQCVTEVALWGLQKEPSLHKTKNSGGQETFELLWVSAAPTQHSQAPPAPWGCLPEAGKCSFGPLKGITAIFPQDCKAAQQSSTIEIKFSVKIYMAFKQCLQSSALFKFIPINKLGTYRWKKKCTVIWFCLISKS